MKKTIGYILILVTSVAKGQDLKLWYDAPAERWEETLPLGNGLIGMMPDGKVEDERLVLNEISMWSGSPQDANNYQANEHLGAIQELLFQGRNDEAEDLVNEHFVCSGVGSAQGAGAEAPYGCFQNFGYLNFLHFNQGNPESYQRWLDLKEAKAVTQFSSGGTQYRREYFTSFSENVGVVRLHADKKESIGFALHFYRDERVESYRIQDNEIHIQGALPDGRGGTGIRFAATIRVLADGGELSQHDHELILKGADQATILFSATTDYYEHDPEAYLQEQIRSVASREYDQLLRDHLEKYQPLFDRVDVQIADASANQTIPTPERLSAFYENPSQDNGLAVLYYQFGRYLTLSSTAPDVAKALPPNLQGLWAHQIQTPWNGDYHLNINAQMNHWGVGPSNLSEYHEPFINMIKDLAVQGRKTAEAYYGAPGWVVYMMTNAWGYTAPGEQAAWGASTASGWLCNHLWEQYRFTMDQEYLADIYPILKDAAAFYQATMVRDPKTGWLVTSPSVSPENSFKLGNGKTASVVMGPTIDNQIVRELYTSVISANRILKLSDPFAAQLAEELEDLPPAVQVSSSGRVMEWLEDYPETEPKHRHVSHLYGLYPANFISPISTPEWAEAARKSLEARGDGGTGWSRAWKILFWARLHDGNHSLEILRQLLQPAAVNNTAYQGTGAGTYPNLFCAHPPFQIDGNFGGSAGIAEMLLQSHDGYIHLLPALPDAWKDGSFRGLKARGNYTVDLKWEDGKVTEFEIHGEKGSTVRVLKNNEEVNYRIGG